MPKDQSVLFEVVKRRTRGSKTFALLDGTFRTMLSSVDLHFDDDQGSWFDLNTDLFDAADFNVFNDPVNKHGRAAFETDKQRAHNDKKAGTLNRDNYDFHALQVPYYAKIPRNIKRGYSIGVDGTVLTFKPIGVSPAKGYVDDTDTNVVHYQDAWNDTDITIEILRDRLKESIILKTDRAPASFSFEVDGPLADDLTAGSLSLASAWLVDATGTQRDVTQTVRHDQSGKTFVDMSADVTGLQYPITIDPTVTLSGSNDSGDTYVHSTQPTNANYTLQYLNAGWGENGTTAINRLLVQFNLTAANIPSIATVTSAKLNLTVTGETGGLNGSMWTMYLDAYRITSTWGETGVTWNAQPTYAGSRTAQLYTGGGKSAGSVDTWDVTSDVQAFVNGTYANNGWMIRDTSESGTGLGYMTYASKEYTNYASYVPNLTINYAILPSAPKVTSPNGGETWNAQQTITWTAAQEEQTDGGITTSEGSSPPGAVVLMNSSGNYLRAAQVFTVPSGVTSIKSVEVLLSTYANGNPGSATSVFVEVWNASGNVPTTNPGNNAVQVNIPQNEWYKKHTVVFASPVPVTPGQQYAIVVTANNATAGAAVAATGSAPSTNFVYGRYESYGSSTWTQYNEYFEMVIHYLQSAGLSYQIDLSEDNGSTWSTIVSQTAAGATSYTYDFSSKAQSSTCLIRIRAYDGTSYGPYDQSDGVFTIQHDQAPLQPTNLSPSGGAGVDRASVIRLSWQTNDPDTNDQQSKFDLQYSTDSGTTWTTLSQSTPNEYYDVPANTFAHGNVVWKVRTYDQSGLSGPYSDQATFVAGDKPTAPAITSPTNGSEIGISRPTIQWSSYDQTEFQVQVLDAANTVLWDSGDTVSTNKAVTVGVDIANGTAITIQARIKNSDNVWSDWASVTATISYTPPAQPTIITTANNVSGRNELTIVNPAPTGSQPTVTYNDLFKRESGSTDWVRIATNLIPNATFQDYSAASGQSYDYKVTSAGSNGTSIDSSIQTVTLTLAGAWLHNPSSPDSTIHRFKYDGEGRSADHNLKVTLTQLEGRTLPVADVADQETQSVKITVRCLKGTDDLTALRALLAAKETVLYRDGRGRKMYGFLSALPEQDTQFGTDIDLTIDAVDYQEVV